MKKPSHTTILLWIFGAFAMTMVIYCVVLWGENTLALLVSSVTEGDFSPLLALVPQSGNLAGLVAVLTAFSFLLFLGVYADMADRTGFPVTSRWKLVASPVLFSIVVLATSIPTSFAVISPLFSLQIPDLLIMLIPAGIAIFVSLVVVGALPLWILHRKEASFKKAVLLSVRLLLSPLIDAFWSAVTVLAGILIAAPIFLVALFANTYLLFNTVSGEFSRASDYFSGFFNAILSAGEYILSPLALCIFAIPFCVIGLFMAWRIFKDGPSLAMSEYCLVAGFVASIATGIAILYIYYLIFWNPVGIILVANPLSLGLLTLALFCVCAFVFIVFFIVHWLLMWLGIGSIFGLLIVIVSSLLLVLFFGGVPSIPFVGQLIMDLIPYWAKVIVMEIGVVGIITGALVTVVTFYFRMVSYSQGDATGEEGQVFSNAMAISIGASSVLPFLLISALHLPGLIGGLIGSLLVFLFISPIYLVAVNMIRIVRGVRALVIPRRKENRQDLKNKQYQKLPHRDYAV